MKLEAKQRLMADVSGDAAARAREAKKQRTDQIDKSIDNYQKQIMNLKKNMPSRQNRMSVSPKGRIGLQKQILEKKQRIADQRLKRIQTKEAT